MPNQDSGFSRRDILRLIGLSAGTSAMYGMMSSLGHARESPYRGRIKLEGDPKGASVVVLGAGLAGMAAALELRAAGYTVSVLEYQDRPGGRCMTLRGGDTIEEISGHTQKVKFSEGQYFNPGPWRIPHHHHAVLDYCKRLGVKLETFIQENQSAYLHSTSAFGGKPVRYGKVYADYVGHVSELLSKATNQGALDETLGTEDREMLLESLRAFGVLDKNMHYRENLDVSAYRGYERAPGGGLGGAPVPSKPIDLDQLLSSGFWAQLREHNTFVHHAPMFQPVGGMDMIAKAFEREVGDLITYGAKVTKIAQPENGVSVEYTATDGSGTQKVNADWCVCTIPFSILGQIDADVSDEIIAAIDQMYYNGAFKAGLEFKRRFWEEDEQIYGGISYTDLPIDQIAYPSADMFSNGPGVLLGAYHWDARAYQFNSLSPAERLSRVLDEGLKIHPQYKDEFSNGVTMSWHQMSWVLGCWGVWQTRDAYEGAARMDRRLVCAGEHLSHLPAWQEGALLSALDAVERLHQRAVQA